MLYSVYNYILETDYKTGFVLYYLVFYRTLTRALRYSEYKAVKEVRNRAYSHVLMTNSKGYTAGHEITMISEEVASGLVGEKQVSREFRHLHKRRASINPKGYVLVFSPQPQNAASLRQGEWPKC